MTSPISQYGLRPELPLYFDNQVTGNFTQCRRRVYYSIVLGRQRIGRDETALSWGRVFHKGVEILETTQDVAFLEAYINEHLEENLADRYGRTRGRMFEALMTWLEWRQTHPIKTLRTEQAVLVKCPPGSVDCPYKPGVGCDLEYGGIKDRVVDWEGYVGPLDFKTTVKTDSDPVTTYRMDHQMGGYVWIASHLMGRHCWGAIIERIITNKSAIKIDRFPIPYSKGLIEEWADNERRIQAELRQLFIDHPENETAWIQNWTACTSPYLCTWRDVCLAPKDMNFRYKWLRDNTIERRWNFLDRDAEEDQLAVEAE